MASKATNGAGEMEDFHQHAVDATPASLQELLDSNKDAATSVPAPQELINLQEELKLLSASAQRKAKAFEQDAELLSRRYRHIWIQKADSREKQRQQHELELHSTKLRQQEEEMKNEVVAGKIPAHQTTSQAPSTTKQENGASEGGNSMDQDRPTKRRKLGEGEDDDEDDRLMDSMQVERPVMALRQDVTAEEMEERKRLGVARFPKHDLLDLLPGIPPSADFTKNKPANQTATATFFTAMEPYFRHFTEDDLAFLREQGDQLTPYIMPTLGPFYRDVWSEEEDMGSHFRNSSLPRVDGIRGGGAAAKVAPSGSADVLTDAALETENISCGPLAERILCTLIREETLPGEETKQEDGERDGSTVATSPAAGGGNPPPAEDSNPSFFRVAPSKADFSTLEERLVRELKFIGLFPDGKEPKWNYRADDEVAAHLRALQVSLRKQSEINAARKAAIAGRTHEQLAFQEYTTILEDLDKQVEQAFMKRSRTAKAKKKRVVEPNEVVAAGGSHGGSVASGVGEYMRSLMDRRGKWISKVGTVFQPMDSLRRIPAESIFHKELKAESSA